MIHYKQKLLEYSSLGRELAGLPYKKSLLKALYKLLEIKLPHDMPFNVTNLPQPNLDTPANIARKLSTFFLLLGTEGAFLRTYQGDAFFIKKDGSITKDPDGSLVGLVTSVGDPIKLITFDLARYDNSVPRKQSQRAKQQAKTPFYKTFLNKSVPWQLKIFEKVEAALKELLIRKIKSGNVSKSADIFWTLKFLDDNLNNLRVDPDDAGLRNYFRQGVGPALELTAKHIWPEIINLPRSEQLKKINEIEKSILEEGNKGYMAIFMKYLLQRIYTFRASEFTESKNNGKMLLEYSSLGKELKGLPYKKNLEKYLHTKEEIAHDVEIEKKEIPKEPNELFRLILSSPQQQDDVVILGSTAALFLTWLGTMPEQVVIHQDKTIFNQKWGPIFAQKGDPAKNLIDYVERTIGTIKGIFYLKKKKELDAYREKKNKRAFKSGPNIHQIFTTLGLSTKLWLLKKTEEQLSNRFLQIVKNRSYSEKTTYLFNAIRALDRWINQLIIHPEAVDEKLVTYLLECIDDAIINTSFYLFKGVGKNLEKLLKSILQDGNKGHYQVFLQFLRQQMLEKIIKDSGYYVAESKKNNKILLEYSVFGKELKGLPYKKNFEKFYLRDLSHTVPIKVLTVPGPEITNDLDLYKNIWPTNTKTENIIVGTKGAAIVQSIIKTTVFVVTSKRIEIEPFPKRDILIIQGLVKNNELQTAIDTIKNAVGEIVKIIKVNTESQRYNRVEPPEQKPKDDLARELAKKIDPILFSILQNIEAELSGKMLQIAKNRSWTQNSRTLFKALLILKQWLEQNKIDNSIFYRDTRLITLIISSVEQAMRMTIAYVYKEQHPISDDYKKLLDSITKKGNEGNLAIFLAFFKQAMLNNIVTNHKSFLESKESFLKESTVLLQEASNLNSVLQDVKNRNSLIKTLYKEFPLTPDVKFTVSPLSNKSIRLKTQRVYILVGDKDAAVLGYLGTWVKVAWRTSPDLNQWAIDEFDTQPAIDVAFSVIGNPKTIIELTPDTNKTEKIVKRRRARALKFQSQGASLNFINKKILPVIRPIIIKSQEIVYDLADITIKNKNHQQANSLLDFLQSTEAFLHGLKDIELSDATLQALNDTAEYMDKNFDDPNVAKFIHISKPKINREPWILVANEIALGNAKVLKIFLDFFRQRILSGIRQTYFESVEKTQSFKTELAFLKNKKPLFDILSKNFGIDLNSEYMTLTSEEFFADEILNASVNLVIGTTGILLFGSSRSVFYMTYFHFDSLGNLKNQAKITSKKSMYELVKSGLIGKVEKVLLFGLIAHDQSKVVQRKLLRTKLPMIKGEKIKNPKLYLYKRFEPIMLKAIENAYNEVQGLLINALKKKNFRKAQYLNYKANDLQQYIVHWPFNQSPLGSIFDQTLEEYFNSALSQAAIYLYPESSDQNETRYKLIQDIVEGNGQNLAVIWGFFKQLLLSGHRPREP